MSPELSPEPRSSRIDVRALSLVQLQKLAERGSRRARAELEGRMRAAAQGAPDAVTPRVPPRASTAAPVVASAPSVASVASAPRPSTPPRPSVAAAAIPTLTVRADGAAVSPAAPAGALPSDALIDQLQLIAQQERVRERADGPPRLVGLVMMGWGALLLLGGLVMLAHGGGLFYAACGLGSAAVGWLLMRCSRWALVAHGALLLAMLGWAWAAQARPSLGVALVQAAPVLIAAAWMAVRSVREPLE